MFLIQICYNAKVLWRSLVKIRSSSLESYSPIKIILKYVFKKSSTFFLEGQLVIFSLDVAVKIFISFTHSIQAGYVWNPWDEELLSVGAAAWLRCVDKCFKGRARSWFITQKPTWMITFEFLQSWPWKYFKKFGRGCKKGSNGFLFLNADTASCWFSSLKTEIWVEWNSWKGTFKDCPVPLPDHFSWCNIATVTRKSMVLFKNDFYFWGAIGHPGIWICNPSFGRATARWGRYFWKFLDV